MTHKSYCVRKMYGIPPNDRYRIPSMSELQRSSKSIMGWVNMSPADESSVGRLEVSFDLQKGMVTLFTKASRRDLFSFSTGTVQRNSPVS